MNVLVVGNGGREHALAWKLSRSPQVSKVYVAPGNAGTAIDAENVDISQDDFPALIQFAKEHKIGLTVVGPEGPLVGGLVDAFVAEGLRVFGPNKKAAQMEGSKIFCKEVLNRALVPTARSQAFDNPKDAYAYLNATDQNGYVVKAGGLAAGKGVVVCDTKEEAFDAVRQIAEDRAFGAAGDHFLIEERLTGQEASVLAITDGQTIMTLQPAQDHKAAYDGDVGPKATHNAHRLHYAAESLRTAQEILRRQASLESLDIDRLERDSFLRHDIRLEAVLRTDVQELRVRYLFLNGPHDGQGGIDMPAGAAAGNDDPHEKVPLLFCHAAHDIFEIPPALLKARIHIEAGAGRG